MLLPSLGQAGIKADAQPTDAPLLPDLAATPAAIAGQGQAATGEALGTSAPLPAAPTAVAALAATPAPPAATDGSGGLVQPAVPPNGQAVSPAAGTGAETAAAAAQQGLQGSTLGQAISEIASPAKGSPELPSLLHAAMNNAGQPRFLSPGGASAQLNTPEHGPAAATAGAVSSRTGATPAVSLPSASPGLSPMASDTAALHANGAASGADLLPFQVEAPSNPNAALAPSQSALAAGTSGPEMAARSAVPQQPAADQVAIAIQKAQSGGREQISLRLYPAELGRIDVHLELADDGVLRASILAEKADTLELLQRDSSALERALQNAGVKTDSGSLAFDLKNGGRDGESGAEGADRKAGEAKPDELDEASPTLVDGRPSHHLGLLDLSV